MKIYFFSACILNNIQILQIDLKMTGGKIRLYEIAACVLQFLYATYFYISITILK